MQRRHPLYYTCGSRATLQLALLMMTGASLDSSRRQMPPFLPPASVSSSVGEGRRWWRRCAVAGTGTLPRFYPRRCRRQPVRWCERTFARAESSPFHFALFPTPEERPFIVTQRWRNLLPQDCTVIGIPHPFSLPRGRKAFSATTYQASPALGPDLQTSHCKEVTIAGNSMGGEEEEERGRREGGLKTFLLYHCVSM